MTRCSQPGSRSPPLKRRPSWHTGLGTGVTATLPSGTTLGQKPSSPTGNASASKTRVLALSARFRMLKGDHEQAIRVAQEALTLAEALELDELRAHALTTIGSAKFHMDLSTGRPELEEGLRIALAADSPIAAVSLNNLGVLSIWEGNFARSREIYPEAQRIAERFGDRDSARFMRGNWIFGSMWWAIGTKQCKLRMS